MTVTTRIWCGVDLGTRQSTFAAIDASGRRVAALTFDHTEHDLAEVVATIKRLTRCRNIAVGVESPSGPVVRRLANAGLAVHHIHPGSSARFRDLAHPSRTKSDTSDAVTLANMVRLEPDRHRRLPNDRDLALSIRALARLQQDLAWHLLKQHSRLHALLTEYNPGAIAAFSRLVRPYVLKLLDRCPLPEDVAMLTEQQREEMRAQYGRRAAKPGVSRYLDSDPMQWLAIPPEMSHSARCQIRASVHLCEAAVAELDAVEAELLSSFRRHPLYPIYASFPCMGGIIGARILGEIGDDPNRFATPKALRAFAGTSPVTRQSGGHTVVKFRRVANRRLAATLHIWVFPLLKTSGGSRAARARYDHRREVGDRHNAAVRNVANYYIGVLYACLTTGTAYDEQRLLPPPFADQPTARNEIRLPT